MSRVSFGMIVRDFISPEPLLHFVRNAKEHGHNIYSVVIAYSNAFEISAQRALEAETKFFAVRINNARILEGALNELGIHSDAKRELLFCPTARSHGIVPYGFNRNTVMMLAAVTGTQRLIFVDHDVKPEVLYKADSGAVQSRSIDFTGRHIRELEAGADLTTSDYSGYNILPPAHFKEMDSLLFGVQKDDMAPFWQKSAEHNCLTVAGKPQIREATKILGGNLGINLSAMSKLPPFFSPVYKMGDRIFLARGEDTVISFYARGYDLKYVDIDTPIFHDTYGNYPQAPDLQYDPSVQRRFYFACTGWLGRNPFLNWLYGRDVQAERDNRPRALEAGARALCEYTGNLLYLELPLNFCAAYFYLPNMVEQYLRTKEAWSEFQKGMKHYENSACKSLPAGRVRERHLHKERSLASGKVRV